MRLYQQAGLPLEQVPQQQAAKFENDAGRYWDLFYKRNADKFFKDRHYFDKEFPELTSGQLTVLEVGCGAGNSVFPLLELNPQLYVYACDFSPRAVQLVQSHPAYERGRVTAFVADITQHEGPAALAQKLPGPCVDYCSMVFVLSAVAPQQMPQALRNIASVLKPGSGRVLFRDYAEGDLAQTRLEDSSSGVRQIRGNFYARGDGTCCYYFTEAELSALFAAEGFICESMIVHARVIENRKSGVKMPRRWLQAVFRFDPSSLLQQQQQEMPVPPTATHDGRPIGNSSSRKGSSDNAVKYSCAGRSWLIPSSLMDNSSSSSDGGGGSSSDNSSSSSGCCCLAQALAGLGKQHQQRQQQALLLGQYVLIAPPWLLVKARTSDRSLAQCDDHGAASVSTTAAAEAETATNTNCRSTACRGEEQLQQQPPATLTSSSSSSSGSQAVLMHQELQSPGARPCVCCAGNGPSGSSSSTSSSSSWAKDADSAQQQGAAAALLALVAVWLGARRVYVCLPGTSEEGSQAASLSAEAASNNLNATSQQQQGSVPTSVAVASGNAGSSGCNWGSAYEYGFASVMRLNECSVVAERIFQRRWQQGHRRQGQLLQRELSRVLQSRAVLDGRGLMLIAEAAKEGCSCSRCSSSSSGGCGSSGGGCGSSGDVAAVDAQQVMDEVWEVCSTSTLAECRQLLLWRQHLSLPSNDLRQG